MKKFATLLKSSFFFLPTILLSMYASQLRAQEYGRVASDLPAAPGADPSNRQRSSSPGTLAPDLLIAAAPQLGPTPLAAGNPAVVRATVQNVGSRRAGFSVLGYYLSADATPSGDDVLLGDAITSALAPGSSLVLNTTLTVPTGTVPGSYYLLCVADYLHLVPESNHRNNGWALRLQVAAPATQAPGGKPAAPQAVAALPTSRAEQSATFDFSIAPNPVAAATPLRVQLSTAAPHEGSQLALYNSMGQQVSSQILDAGNFSQAELSTSGLAAGVYMLRLTGPSLHATHRVVVK